jgi:hypothetical protein
METFRREGRRDPDTRRDFYAAGGFCSRHGWLFHELVEAHGSGAEIADIYGALADRDLAGLAVIPVDRRRRHSLFERSRPCPACVAGGEASDRRAFFVCQALAEESVRRRYGESDGLCFYHLAAVLKSGYADDPLCRLLVEQWQARLQEVRAALAEFDRKRDHRFAGEPRGDEQHSWSDVIRRYTGSPGSPDLPPRSGELPRRRSFLGVYLNRSSSW